MRLSATFHVVADSLLVACDLCGAVVDPAEPSREAHARWHGTHDVELIDVRGVTDASPEPVRATTPS